MPGIFSLQGLSHNLSAWMVQTIVIATVAALLPILGRVRHPRTQLHYCHAVLALCLLLPFIAPLFRRSLPAMDGHILIAPNGKWLLGILAAGIALQLCRMSAGLWRIRRSRIGATPLYPVPEAMRAASAITQADALFCMSEEATGPVMLGWLAPVVLLPASFLAMDEEAQCGIACHELLHVRRGDWLVTLIEEFAGALLWFNPGIWLLLSEARLAREQLVDAESVRLTASREPYIDALLAIAREHTWSDLAPAPTFLRRSHLTQRMQSLLSDAPASAPRIAGSYGFIAAILACTTWLVCASFPVSGEVPGEPQQPPSAHQSAGTAPAVIAYDVPAAPATAATAEPKPSEPPSARRFSASPVSLPPVTDPYEPVAGGVQAASTPQERASALLLLATARERALRHAPGSHPYRFSVQFTAHGNVIDKGQGELTETWLAGQKWRWTAKLGDVSHVRLLYRNQLLEDRHLAVIPMRAHMLRNEIFWALSGFPRDARIRTARIQWQGKPATCILGSEPPGDAEVQGRQWDEEEYCIDDASGNLVVHSIAPGTYAQFGYDAQIRFHGLQLPDRIGIYVAGALAADASFNITDAGADDEDSLTPVPGMTATPLPTALGSPFFVSTNVGTNAPGGQSGSASQAVIVHVEIDGEGNVFEKELSAAQDATMAPAALEQAGRMNFGHTGTERQAYIEVRFSN